MSDLAKAAADAMLQAMSTTEEQAFSSCLDYIEEEMARFTPGSEEEEDFREQTMMDLFRNAGAPMTLVKQLHSRYTGGRVSEYTADLGEVVGLLMFGLKEDPCILCANMEVREKLIAVADEAYKELDEKKKLSSPFPTVKEEGATEVESTTKKHRGESELSSAVDDDYIGEEDDAGNEEPDDDAEDDSSSSSSSSSSTSKSRKEMNRMIEAKQYVHIEKIAQIFANMNSPTRKRVERLLHLLHVVSLGSEDDCYVLSETFAPMFTRPPGTAYMSIRHHRELPRIRLILWVWIENYEEIMHSAKEPHAMTSTTKSAASTPPPGSRHLLMHAVKPRLSSVSSTGVPFSPPTLPLHAPVIGEGGELGTKMSPGSRHVRRKTPPRIADLMQKRKIDLDQLESVINSAVELLFPPSTEADEKTRNQLKSRLDSWIAQETGYVPPELARTYSSGRVSDLMDQHLSPPKRQWATRERVIIEKRVLKKRLLHWDKEFEQKNNRKPGKEDRYEMRSVFHAYGALKTLLQALEAPNAQPNSESLLVLEKRALQAVLKLFEKDFEERMGRKVEVAADIAGRELEYSRYKELKESVKAT